MRKVLAEALKAADIPKKYRGKVKERLSVLEYAAENGIRCAARRFGLSRNTIRTWRRRMKAEGLVGLVPRYPARRPRKIDPAIVELVIAARTRFGYGSTRTQMWLWRVNRMRVSQTTIQAIVRDHGLPKLRAAKKRRPRQLRLFERDNPGEVVQVDVKHVRVGGRMRFQYTAIDDCTRYRVLRLYTRVNQLSSLDFLRVIRREFPFAIRCIQTDNGSEFPLAFRLTCEEVGIEHRYTRPRRPQQNGKVERSHRIDNEEFWTKQSFRNFEQASGALPEWQRFYNHERFSMALRGRTPAERLSDFAKAA